MADPFAPTILYPNGGESISSSEITVRWSIPDFLSPDGRPVSFELFFTDNFDSAKEPDWKQIATLPSTVSQYVWRFGGALRSSKVRVAIRTVNIRGERSAFAISAGDFSIRRRKLMPPVVISPHAGERFDKTAEIVFDDAGLAGTYSQRSSYQVFYSSEKAGVTSTPVAQNVPVGSIPVIWDTLDLTPSDDYVLQIYLADDDGNRSDSIFIKSVNIVHEGFFIIDTVPPVGTITINNNATFTNKQNVTVNLLSYDQTTNVHAMQLLDGTSRSKPLAKTNATRFTLSDGDDIKTVQLLMQDYGANRNNQELQRILETTVELADTTIADIAIDRDASTLYAVTSGTSNYLYRYTDFPALLTSFVDSPTAVGVFKGSVYVATASSDRKGTVHLWNGSDEAYDEFVESDSVVNTMAEFGDDLFLGMENGSVYTFDGLTFDRIAVLSEPIRQLYSDGNLLYLVLKNDDSIFIYNGTTFFDAGE